MADSTILDAQVKLTIDTTSIDKSIKQATGKLEAGLSKADAKLSKQLTKQLDKDIGRIGKQFEKGADKLSKGLEKGLKFGLGTATTALFAFLKSGTPEALRFSMALDKVKVAWAKVGQTLATKINFKGKNLTEWVEVIADKIANLDTKQIEKIVGYFKIMAATWATIKIGQGVNTLGQFGGTIANVASSLMRMRGVSNTGSNIGAGATALGGTAAAAGLWKMFSIKSRTPGPNFSMVGGKSYDPLLGLLSGKEVNQHLAPAGMPKDSFFKSFGKIVSAGQGMGLQGLLRRVTLIPDILSTTFKSIEKFRGGDIGGGIGEIGMGAGRVGTTLAAGWAGTKAGGALGSFFGPVGTAVGALVGGITATTASFFGFEAILKKWKGPIGEAFEGFFSKSQAIELTPEVQKQLDEAATKRAMLTKRNAQLGELGNITPALRKSEVYRGWVEEQKGMFPGGEMPAFKLKTTNIVQNTIDKIGELTKEEEKLSKIWESFTDEERAFDTTIKPILDKVTAEKNYWLGEQNKQVAIWRNQKDKEKKHNETLLQFDRDAIEARTKYENTLTDINKNKDFNKPLQTSISMGGDISSIPSIISQSLNEQKNAQSEKLSEDFQKIIDTNLASLQYQMDLFNLAAEEKKYREETLKQDRDDRKDIKTYVKEMKDAITPRSSTATVLK